MRADKFDSTLCLFKELNESRPSISSKILFLITRPNLVSIGKRQFCSSYQYPKYQILFPDIGRKRNLDTCSTGPQIIRQPIMEVDPQQTVIITELKNRALGSY